MNYSVPGYFSNSAETCLRRGTKQVPPASAALGVGMTNPKSDKAVIPTRELREAVIGYFFSEISMVARVFSQSRYMWQPLPISWKEMVKFSTGPEVFETLMS